MNTVKAYKTSDDKLFEVREEAKKHQAKVEFYDWYPNNKLLGNYAGSYVDSNDLLEWLNDNKKIVFELLGVGG